MSLTLATIPLECYGNTYLALRARTQVQDFFFDPTYPYRLDRCPPRSCATRYSDFEVAIGDRVSTVRFAVIEALTPRFDEYLAQAQNLRVLFIALNDEVSNSTCCNTCHRTSHRFESCIHSSCVATDVGSNSCGTQIRFHSQTSEEEQDFDSSHRSCARLVRPYLPAIIRALLPRLADKNVVLRRQCWARSRKSHKRVWDEDQNSCDT